MDAEQLEQNKEQAGRELQAAAIAEQSEEIAQMSNPSNADSPSCARLELVVLPEHSTVHLPAGSAVVTTPAIVGLMELCIAAVESQAVQWTSRSATVLHKAGLRTGETLVVSAKLSSSVGEARIWEAVASAADGRLIASGQISRVQASARSCQR